MKPALKTDIPEFLQRKPDGALAFPKAKAPKVELVKAIAPVQLPALPEGLRWAATESEETGSSAELGIVPRRWASDPSIARFLALAIRDKGERKKASLESFKASMAAKKAAEPKVAKPSFGSGVKFHILRMRNPDTKAGKRHTEMAEYLKAHPNCDVAEMLAGVKSAGKADFTWAVANKYITTDLKTNGDANGKSGLQAAAVALAISGDDKADTSRARKSAKRSPAKPTAKSKKSRRKAR